MFMYYMNVDTYVMPQWRVEPEDTKPCIVDVYSVQTLCSIFVSLC